MKFSKIIKVVLLLSSICFAQSGIEPYELERVGQAGWQFLKINGDSRQAAIGGAYTALNTKDANSIFGNPAVIAHIKNIDISLNRTNWIADIGYNSIAVVKSFEGIGSFGVSLANVDYGDIPETINSVIEGEGRTEAVVTGRYFTASDLAIGVSYARNITENLSVGGNIRWIRESIAEVSMENWTLDIGTLFYTGYRSLRLGFSARNFGPDSRFLGFSEEYQSEPVDVKMPLDFRFGVAMDFLDEEGSDHLVTVAIDANHPNDGPEKIRIGTEYSFSNQFFLRAGYKFNYDEENFTFGAGINYPVWNYMLTFNYAYVDFGNLNQVHMISLGFTYE